MSEIIYDNQYVAGITVKITVSNTAISLGDVAHLTKIQPTSGTFSGKSATDVWIHCVDSGIYYAPGGTTPVVDGSVGHPMEVKDFLSLKSFTNIKNAKFIRQGAVDGAIMVTPFFSMA